jgi:hypothetical protein
VAVIECSQCGCHLLTLRAAFFHLKIDHEMSRSDAYEAAGECLVVRSGNDGSKDGKVGAVGMDLLYEWTGSADYERMQAVKQGFFKR